MSKPLTEEQQKNLPEDEDYRNWVLLIASENNWVFNERDYAQAIAKIKKGALGRVELAIKELEDSRVLIKRPNGRIYDVTNDGIKRFKNGEFKSQPTGMYTSNTKFEQEDKSTETKLTAPPKDDSKPDAEENYTIRKLNRTADSIDQVQERVSTSTKIVAGATLVSALAMITQVIILIWFNHTTIDGNISISPKQAIIDSLNTKLQTTTEQADIHQMLSDSLEKELQKLTTILDSTSQELIKE